MKQGWNKKPVGDICKILNGFAFKSNEYVEDGVRVMRITNVQKGYIVDDDPQFFPINRENEISKYMLSDGDLLMSLTGNVGRVGVLTSEFLPAALNQRVACLRIKESTGVNLKYLFHILNSKTFEDDCIINATGIAQKNMSTKWLENYLIPVPPIAEQEKIVAELDCLSGIIEKKKQQLKELDNLAQSIFYEMFGDPVENDKEWEVKKLGDVCSLKAGKAIKANELSDVASDNLYPCFGGNGIRGYIEKVSHHNQYPIIGRQGALCGNVVLSTKEFYATEHAVVVQPVVEMNIYWSYYTLMYMNLNRLAQGVAQPGLSVGRVNQENFILPPLALQQDFASKIESIEKQKELIAKSIRETETLFNSRMDYYFN